MIIHCITYIHYFVKRFFKVNIIRDDAGIHCSWFLAVIDVLQLRQGCLFVGASNFSRLLTKKISKTKEMVEEIFFK